MKKKIFISMFAIAAMALTAFTGYKTFGPKQSMSDLLLDENIEALTDGETGDELLDCYNTITSKKGTQVRYCPICQYVPGTDVLYSFAETCRKPIL